MMTRLLSLLVILPSVLFLQFAQAQKNTEPPAKIKTNARALQKMMENYHCCPRTIDDQYCKDIATLFLKNMDPLRIYFTQADVKQLSDIAAIKDELNGHSQSYSEKATSLFRERLTKADASVSEIALTPFDFNVEDGFYLEEDSVNFAANDKELRDKLSKFMKFNTLDRLMEEVLLDSTQAKVSLKEREPKEREIAGKIRHRRIKHRLEPRWGFENLVTMYLADAIVKANDPHSEFVPEMTDKRNISLRYGSAYSFGLKLKENYKGDVVVSDLVPGSSAWKSGAINKDDILISLQWEELPPTDLEGADVDEVDRLFAEKRYRKLKLTVRKQDGEVKTVILSRGRFYEGSNHVESFILDGPIKLAYVILPSFYGNWESVYGSSCARDVNKCLERLQFEVQGLILDMRYNGGGSLGEANELAGIFIDEGTLGFSKQRGGFSTEMKDPYLGVLYQEPMVVLINNESASATEYVAAALQDYNRAVIVGSPTFGKATAQRFLPADTTIERFEMNRVLYNSEVKDMVKITVAKLYRATGLNNQLLGVQPDIILPTVFDSIGYREQLMSHALSLDTLKRAGTFDRFAPLPIQALREKSAARVEATAAFDLVEKGRRIFAEKKKMEEKPMPMQYDKYMAMSKKYLAEGRKIIKQIQEDSIPLYKTTKWNVAEPDPREKPDPIEEEVKTKLLRRINKDIYVQEAFAIVKDMLELKKK